MRVGVLAIQGDFEKHRRMLDRLNVENIEVKTLSELNSCDGLILPGGESTTLVKLLKKHNLFTAIQSFAKKHPVMGTCAGLILIAKYDPDDRVENLNLIDIDVLRNAYGRQIDSFIADIDLQLNGSVRKYEGVFIRAPKITRVGEQVKVLARKDENILMVESGNILGATFHPELTDDLAIHEYFVKKIN